MRQPPIIHGTVHFQRGGRAPKGIHVGPDQTTVSPAVPRVARLARLMALAIRFADLIRTGAIRDYAELARLGHVSRARITQIMNLLQLAPAIQEEILFLEQPGEQRSALHLRDLQPIARELDWAQQRRRWATLRGR